MMKNMSISKIVNCSSICGFSYNDCHISAHTGTVHIRINKRNDVFRVLFITMFI